MDTVPLDILLDIVVHLPLQCVLALRCTCKTLYAATHLRTLWALLFRMHVLERHIPFPSTAPLDHLSAHDLESLTHRALALHHTWTSPRPVPRRTISFNTEPYARIIFLQFLPARSNRWLISVSMSARPRSYLLQCWDVARDHPTCVAELRHADGPYGGVVLNSDPTSSAVLAMQSAQTEMFSIHFDAQDPECAFETEATIDGIRELHLLSGSTLVTRRIDDGRALSLWDLADLRHEKVQLLNPSLIQPDDRVQAIHIAHDYALVVRLLSIEIYSTTPRPSLLSVRGVPVAYPLAQFKFQRPTDTVVMCAQHPSSSLLAPPIHLLVRFENIHPWPVNVLNHYHLLPNPTYHTAGRPSSGGPTTPSSSPPSPPVTTEYNLPYDPRPRVARSMTVGLPGGMFGQSAMALGRYGTALWLDSHTSEWPSDNGQRLAGWVARFGCELGATDAALTPTSNASMVFGVRRDEAWARIAMEEEAGRIALGHTNGAITLLEY